MGRGLILTCRPGHAHRMTVPPVMLAGDHTGRAWVGVRRHFGGVVLIHCLAPDPADPSGQRVVQETCAPDAPYLWESRVAAQEALARWQASEEDGD